MATVMISTRLDENLLAEIDTFAAAKDKTRSDAIGSLLLAGLVTKGNVNERLPGWDSKEIARIAVEYYRGMAAMFEAHNWPERGARMLPSVQRKVADQYDSIQRFIDIHEAQEPEEFQKGLPKSWQGIAPIEQPWPPTPAKQRDFMRDLVKKHGLSKEVVCAAFAEALKAGLVKWKNNTSNYSPEKYADAVWRDGEIKGWLADSLVK